MDKSLSILRASGPLRQEVASKYLSIYNKEKINKSLTNYLHTISMIQQMHTDSVTITYVWLKQFEFPKP
jgi:hypothetical protein